MKDQGFARRKECRVTRYVVEIASLHKMETIAVTYVDFTVLCAKRSSSFDLRVLGTGLAHVPMGSGPISPTL
jgi:hypothetical protein